MYKLCQGRLSRQTDRNQIASDLIARQKGIQCLTDQFFGHSIRLAEKLGVGDVIESNGHNLLSRFRVPQFDGFQTRLTDLNSPC